MIRTVKSLFVICAFFLLAAPSFAAPRPAEEEVRVTIEQVRGVVKAQKASLTEEQLDKKLEEILLPIFDFTEMSRSSLGANWKKATADQQSEFVKLFSSLLSHSYLAKIRKNIENSEVTFLPSIPKEDRIVVRTKIATDDQEIAADYRMYQKDGKWQIYDVLVENVGLVSNYRNEFSSILARQDFPALLDRLRSQIAKNPK